MPTNTQRITLLEAQMKAEKAAATAMNAYTEALTRKLQVTPVEAQPALFAKLQLALQ